MKNKFLILIIVMFLLFMYSVFSFSAEEIQDAVIVCVDFDEGLAKDSSTEARTGTVNGGVVTSSTNTKVGNGSSFFDNSINNPIVFSNDEHMNNMQNLTMLFWTNYTDLTGDFGFFTERDVSSNGGWKADFSPTIDRIACVYKASGGTITTVATVPDFITGTNYELFSCTINHTGDGNAYVYTSLNGTSINDGSQTSTLVSSSDDLIIGDALDDGATERYDGGMDVYMLINLSLSSDDITEHIWNNGDGVACDDIFEADATPPTITLIAPKNNTRNNTIPLNITFQVSDDSAFDNDCVLSNSTTIFDTGIFVQNVDFNLTLAEGENTISQKFLNLNLTCFDNAELNNSATMLLNYTLDNIDPVITPISPGNLQQFNKEIVPSISVNALCNDDPVFSFNVTIFNSTDQIFSEVDNIPVNNQLEISSSLDITNIGLGNYTVRHRCSDPHTKQSIPNYNVNKNISGNSIVWITPTLNEFEFKFSTSPKNPVSVSDYGWNKLNDRYTFWYNINATDDGTEYKWTFELENKKFPVTYIEDSKFNGHFVMGNNWLDLDFIGNEDASYIVTLNANNNYEIEITTTKTFLDFSSVGELNIATVDTTFEIISIPQAVDFLSKAVCDDSIPGMLLLFLLTMISFVVIIMGFHFNVGILGFFGSLLLMVLSWFVAPCIGIFGFLLGALSIVLMLMFIWTGLRIPTSVTSR
ncbi:hypothetical protein LCGC14_1065200 [marine sediment metagenome]|uniref:Uncharacterized protein n=1 Tax=marine sediment metagenome TaxID=412755 RepID=A0A0F9QQQ9_9ZZZZ